MMKALEALEAIGKCKIIVDDDQALVGYSQFILDKGRHFQKQNWPVLLFSNI